MKKFLFALLVAMLCLSVIPVQAMETTTYQFTASSTDTVIPITTYRDGVITASAMYKPSNHGLYGMWIYDANGSPLCWETYDFRYGRTPALPQVCSSTEYGGSFVPAGNYTVVFRASMGGKVNVTMDVSAETNP